MNTLYNTKHSNNQIHQQQDGQSPYYHLQNGYHLSKGQAQSSSPSHKMQNILSSTIAIQQQQQQQNQQQQLQQKQQQKINNSKDTSPLNQTGSFRNGQQKKSFIFQNNYANKNLINNKLNQNNKISQNQKRRKLIDAQNTSNNKANKSINKNYANTPGRQLTINTQNQTSILNHSNLLNQGNLTSGNTNNNVKKMFGNKGFTPKNNQQKFRLTKGFTHHSKNQNNEYMQNIYQIIDSVPNSKTTLDQSHNLNNSKHINKTTINNFETADQYQSFNYNNENFLNVQDQQQKQGTKKQLYNITSFKINQAKNNGQPLSTRMQGQNLQLDDIENKAQQYYFPQGIGQSQKSGNYTNRENYLKSFDLKNANHSYRNTSENQNKIHRMAQQQADTKLINNQSNNNHLNPYQKGKTIPLKNFQNQAQNKQSSELNSLRQTQNLKNINKEENQAYQNQQQFTQKLQNLNLTQNQKQNQNQTPKNQKNVTNLKDQKRQTFFENMKKPDLKDMKEGFKKFDFLIKNRPNRGQTTYENINNTNINNYNNNNNNNNNNNSRQQQNKQQNNNQQQPVYYDLNQFFFNSSKAQQSSDNNNNYKSENTTRATSNMTQNQSKFTENDHQKNVEDILMNENSMDNFEFGKVLGLGSYAVVRQSVHKPTNQILAIKTYDKKKLSDPMKLKNVQREIKILSRLRHPNIIRLYQIIETDNQVHLIMELSSQTPLNDFMKTKRSKRVNEEEARLIIKQLAEALKYGHRKCVVHRDIKLENVLIDQNKIVKLVDFGFAVVVPPGHYLNIFCGTPSYMAPEIVNKQDYAFSVDVWALAVMAFKLVSGHFPFKGQSDKELYRKINNCRPEFPSFFSPELKRFIMKIFKQSSNERLQAEDIIKDDWIQGRKSEIDDEFSNPEKMFIERVF